MAKKKYTVCDVIEIGLAKEKQKPPISRAVELGLQSAWLSKNKITKIPPSAYKSKQHKPNKYKPKKYRHKKRKPVETLVINQCITQEPDPLNRCIDCPWYESDAVVSKSNKCKRMY